MAPSSMQVEVEQLVDVDRDALAETLAGGDAVGMIEREPVERPAAAREEHPQVGVDLRDGTDGLRLLAPRRLWSITMQGEMFRIASTGGRVS